MRMGGDGMGNALLMLRDAFLTRGLRTHPTLPVMPTAAK